MTPSVIDYYMCATSNLRNAQRLGGTNVQIWEANYGSDQRKRGFSGPHNEAIFAHIQYP
jgi:hypothetical protein